MSKKKAAAAQAADQPSSDQTSAGTEQPEAVPPSPKTAAAGVAKPQGTSPKKPPASDTGKGGNWLAIAAIVIAFIVLAGLLMQSQQVERIGAEQGRLVAQGADQLADITKRIGALERQDGSAELARLGERLAEVEQTPIALDALKAQLAGIEQRLGPFAARLGQLESIDSRLAEAQQHLTALDGRTAKLDAGQSELVAGNGDLSARADALAAKLDAAQGELGSRIDAASARAGELAAKLDADRGELGGRIDDALAKQQAADEALQAGVQGLEARLGHDPIQWALAEAEFLLRTANYSTRLKRDVATALSALGEADQLLQRLDDPALTPVREALAEEINALQRIKAPDVTGLAATLADLAQAVRQMPLKDVRNPALQVEANVERGGLAQLAGSIWDSLRSLVVVRHRERPVDPLMAPAQQENLYQNLRLQLDTARYALLRGNEAVWESSLATATGWVAEFFRADDPATEATLQALRDLQAVQIAPVLPDISESLRVLTGIKLGASAGAPHRGSAAS